MTYDPIDIEDFLKYQWWYILMSASSSLDEKPVGRICIECEADLSWLPDEAKFCPYCGNELDQIE